MKVTPIKTKIFRENENLLQFIAGYIKKIPEHSVIVVTSKIVALSEGRTAQPKDTSEKNKLIKLESDKAIETKHVWLTLKDGMLMASAGIDESNAGGKLILLPEDSFGLAHKIRIFLMTQYKVKNLGVIISDSGLLPLRNGVIGMALGYAGFKGVKSYKNKKDLFGRKFVFSQVDVADSLATAATLCMGEGDESQPLAVIEDAPVVFTNTINKKEMLVDSKVDIYAPLLAPLYAHKK